MPYITEERIEELIESPDTMAPGDLAWALATNVEAFLNKDDLSFERIGGALAALESVKQEVLHRVLRPYEDGKLMLGADPLESSHRRAIQAFQDCARERVLRDLGIRVTDEPEEDEPPLRFRPPEDDPPAPPPPPSDRENPDTGASPL